MRNTRRTAPVLALTLTPLLLLAACSDGGDDPGAGGEAESIGAVIKGLDNTFFQAMEQGIEEQAAEDGLSTEVQAAASIDDTAGQADRLSAMVGQDFDCMIVNPITATNLLAGLAQIPDGTPVVNIDLPLDADAAADAGIEIATYVGTENENAGQLAGEHMLELLDGEGTVGIIGGLAGDVTSTQRIDGFTAAVEGELEIVGPVAADWSREEALTAATDMMRANPDISGFFAANDDMGLGIVRAVSNENLTDQVDVISVDGNENALQSVADEGLSATVAQYPYAIGQLGIQACQVAAEGGGLPSTIEAPVALVTPDNASDALENFPAPFEEYDNPLESEEE